MRKVIVSNLMSLDGFMAGPSGELDWFVVNDEFFEYSRDLLNNADAILFGRVTYQGMASYWPTATANDSILADKMNTLPKIVFSRSLEKVEWGAWNNATLVKDDIADEVVKLRQQPGKDLVIFGSQSIVSTLAGRDLIDKYQLIIVPVVLAKGKPQFEGVDNPLKLHLLWTKNFSTGVVVLAYEPQH